MLVGSDRLAIFSEIPILVLCPKPDTLTPPELLQDPLAVWKARLTELGAQPFGASSLTEAMAILAECQRSSTPVGLVVLESASWDADAARMLSALKQWRQSQDLAIFLSLLTVADSERELTQLSALEAGADHCFCPPWSHAMFQALVLQKMATCVRIRQLHQDREQALQQLFRERQSAMAQDLWRLDLATRELQFSEQCQELSGYQPQEIGAGLDDWLGLIHPEDLSRLSLALGAPFSGGGGDSGEGNREEWNFEFRLRHKSGTWRWLLLRARLERDADGSPQSVLGTHTDITRSKTSDSVTGLANRFSFEEQLAAILENGHSQPSVILLGIDRHQMLRDSLGQNLGDALLRMIAERLQTALQHGLEQPQKMQTPKEMQTPQEMRQQHKATNFLLARLSGDEFAIAIEAPPEPTASSILLAASAQLEQVMTKPFWLDGREVYVSTSQGLANWDPTRSWTKTQTPPTPSPETSEEFDNTTGFHDEGNGVTQARELWRGAEIALHNAQSAGGSRSMFFDADMRAKVVERMELESELKRAIGPADPSLRSESVHSQSATWEFEVYYQPKVSLQRERIVGFEALIRWRHPERGIIPPSVFIPLAEESGLILPLGLRTIRKACQELARWQQAFPQTPTLEMSVNLSVRQFQDQNLPQEIRKILNETGIPPNTLLFEVTESVLVVDPISALAIVEELRRLGVGLKIDDFGTGYSSLSYLHRLPFDTLKIDKSFISTMGQDHSAYEIVKAIINLARNLGLQVVAEGVETRNQADELREMGCEYAQGYLYAPPLTSDAATRMLEAQRVFEDNRALSGAGAGYPQGQSRGMF